jgi:hypothetical protein
VTIQGPVSRAPATTGGPGPSRATKATVVLASMALLAGCGSSGSSSATRTQRQQECTAVADVLSDGPDPGVDPVGYAEAQVLPLRHLKLSQTSIHRAVANLASAYQAYADAGPKAPASTTTAVAGAQKALNKLCPGAAP